MVGKDIMELLAGAMYADPLMIYREYVQNASDSIDEAREAQLGFDEPAQIIISFDHVGRNIKIKDNGTSIAGEDFVRKLTSVGASTKRGKEQRGFRGVGRLAGLGYCQELIFRGRSSSDHKVHEVHWNGRKLRDLLRDATYDGGLAEIVKEVVTVMQLPSDGFPERFFEVEMCKISRLRNDILLNEAAVRLYLSQVAPVPFDPDFKFASTLQAYLDERGIRAPISIQLADGKGPIYHRVTNQIAYSPVASDEIEAVNFLELKDSDGNRFAFGWILKHQYLGSIPKKLGLGGIRLRAGNMQVGDDAILAPLFPETRLANWVIGDIHIVSRRMKPNGRRDDFEPSVHYAHFQDEIVLLSRSLTQAIRISSAQRARITKIRQHMGQANEWLKIVSERLIPDMAKVSIASMLVQRLLQAEKEIAKLDEGSLVRRVAEQEFETIKVDVLKMKARGERALKRIGKLKPAHRAIRVALEVMMSNAQTPKSGLLMSLKLLEATNLTS
ncbi:MAG: ATP-binding protein [Betaproteobacteria bacterium]|nr:ATP-binding protein [Betaproteobacteria bacterium]